MDRCEDVEPNLDTGKVYIACTNNSDRGKVGKPAPDAPNPRGPNKNGHIIELSEQGNRADATAFSWNIFMLCGGTTGHQHLLRRLDGSGRADLLPGQPGLRRRRNLWVATDGAPSNIGKADGLFRVPLRRCGARACGAVPRRAEPGRDLRPVIHDADGSVFVAVQHPGEDGEWASRPPGSPTMWPQARSRTAANGAAPDLRSSR
jgi:secreted PhoX family phosphatase